MIELLISIILGATLIGIGVHFIPVGGAPAALSTTAGIPTGAPMITIGMGITGILAATSVITQPELIIILAGALGSMIMMSITMLFSNMIHIYGVGVPPASANFEKDLVTGFKQEEYVSPGTTGHGIPTISFISGLIGSLLGGIGGSLAFWAIFNEVQSKHTLEIAVSGSISAILAIMIFFIIAVVASYNIGGTIQGFYDKKFRLKIIPGTISCFIASVMLAIIYMVILGGM
ncbi:tetrahydromethanopterin S-methyltransferase subunit D [Methanosphaera sp. WGK6]|uniref:tetrahydromethanopterin S-methyltransferase subunit D n=1 Tax=Methanosphaera sp. WGK6 TaxID=1561964 RepID=UPI00084CE284|nr:tetrahydromethanopterin S-methyltransferase subunit D [Methanosphaera sp. WGK6]OED30230.1 tetrahydromethanopterin S-methyltransferase subunit D [Methanosphaera sp. WGK6]